MICNYTVYECDRCGAAYEVTGYQMEHQAAMDAGWLMLPRMEGALMLCGDCAHVIFPLLQEQK